MMAATGASPGVKPAPGPARILVADDDPFARELIAEVLGAAGHQVLQAPDGIEALRLARQARPDLLILDVAMPGPDGFQVCQALEAVLPDPPPVIFLTGRGSTADRVRGLDAGASHYLVKPFQPEELKAHVRAALRTRASRDAAAMSAAVSVLTEVMKSRPALPPGGVAGAPAHRPTDPASAGPAPAGLAPAGPVPPADAARSIPPVPPAPAESLPAAPVTQPTQRELDVAALIARGATNRQVALELGLAEGTVSIHVGTILRKLGFRSRAEIAAWAAKRGLFVSDR